MFRACKEWCSVLLKTFPFLAWLITTCTPPHPSPPLHQTFDNMVRTLRVLNSLQGGGSDPLLEEVTDHFGELWRLVQEDSPQGACPPASPAPGLVRSFTPANTRKCELLENWTLEARSWDVTPHSGCLVSVVVSWKPVIPVPVPGTFCPFQPPTPALGET